VRAGALSSNGRNLPGESRRVNRDVGRAARRSVAAIPLCR
jgi:hypothetical protein